jgi:short-subunit dehydrogenase
MDLSNKVILITGASAGIGYALVKELSNYNCSFILLSRRKEPMDNLLRELKVPGEKSLTLSCDVTDPVRVNECINEGHKKFGRIDAAILNSGISHGLSKKEFDTEKGKEIINVNLYGMINCIDPLIPLLKKQEKSIIAGVSSLAEGRGFPKTGFYSASKAAVSILLESLRVDLKGSGIKVITIKPGFVRTPMTDKNEFRMPFLMEPAEAAKAIIKGLEKEKRIIQFPLMIVLSSKLIKIMPDFIYEWSAGNVLNSLREKFSKKRK